MEAAPYSSNASKYNGLSTKPRPSSRYRHSMTELNYSQTGTCPICEQQVQFTSKEGWYRDHLLCSNCPGGSKPRERALMFAIRTFFPNWQTLSIHESSPMERGASVVLREQCAEHCQISFQVLLCLERKTGA